MGLQPLRLQDWIEIGADYEEQLQRKRQLFADRLTDVFAYLPGSEAAQQEVLDLLIAHLLQHFPQYRQEGDCLWNQATAERWQISDFAATPLDLAGRLVQEDLCLLLPAAEGYVLSAASLCFPSRWSLHEKLGQPVAQIHQPVPGYAEKLAHPVDRLFDRLRPDRPGYRFNWSLVDTPELFLPDSTPIDPSITAENVSDRLWLRVERQTLRRLTHGILFTVRTYRHALSAVVAEGNNAEDLAAALWQMPTETQVYKSLQPIWAALLGYLRQAADRAADGQRL
ncbi:DUF3445 domain-containing protein [Phormidium tenue FACHB-886]|nr:DUF3445 domain-containing protein [Phormidium tenue FACHB-886]